MLDCWNVFGFKSVSKLQHIKSAFFPPLHMDRRNLGSPYSLSNNRRSFSPAGRRFPETSFLTERVIFLATSLSQYRFSSLTGDFKKFIEAFVSALVNSNRSRQTARHGMSRLEQCPRLCRGLYQSYSTVLYCCRQIENSTALKIRQFVNQAIYIQT